jgi:hypothetical protein
MVQLVERIYSIIGFAAGIYAQAVDIPIGLTESGRVVVHV